MMIGLAPVNISSTAINGTVKIEGNSKRRYFAIYSSVDVDVTIDGVSFTLPAGTAYAPIPAPTNAITVVGTTGTIMEG